MSSKIGMSQVRDTPVKLFGSTISTVFVPVSHDPLSSSSPVLTVSSSSSSASSPSIRPHMINNQSASDNTSLKLSSDLIKESKETSENSDDQHSEITTTTSEEDKPTNLKKPDKILPCPRCNSADTKFCYYNNYNVNQPRYFCRNCQRYWTAGGSMRTVPVGSGRRKNKGWVSSDHYLHITSENADDNYNSSSTKILSFESSDSLVTDNNTKHQSSDALFLPPQETSPVSPPWSYQYPPNPSFYHMPVYWGCAAVPVWSTLETSTCLGKRTRDEASHETVRERRDAVLRARLVSESQSINNEASISTKNHVWYPVPTKHENTEQFSFFINGSEKRSSNKRFIPETYLNLQANPAAMARSTNFRESM